jgi:uncharacterized protein (DUF1778 family)
MDEKNRTERMEFRLEPDEKTAFQAAADLAGVPLSSWVRERLRRAARRELEEADQKVPFLKSRL